jgi:hypothetical protein
MGYTVARLVEALRYKLEGRGFDFPWTIGIFLLTQPLTEINTRDNFWGIKAAGT